MVKVSGRVDERCNVQNMLRLCCCGFPDRSRGSPPTLRSASGWRMHRHYSNHRPPRKPSQPALPPQARRGSAPMPPSRQGRPRPERHTPPPLNLARPPQADPRGMPEGRPGGGPPRPHTQGKPPAKIPTTPHPSPRSRATPCVLQLLPLRSRDAFKKRNYKSGLLNTSIPESAVTNKHRGRLLFWIRACRQKALYCACRAPFHSFYSIYLLFFNFSFISPFLFLHYVVVSAYKLAQTTLKFIHSVQMALWDKISLVCEAAGHCWKPPQWMMGKSAYNRLHLVWLSQWGVCLHVEWHCCATLCSLIMGYN